jgi:hypothetical protein
MVNVSLLTNKSTFKGSLRKSLAYLLLTGRDIT